MKPDEWKIILCFIFIIILIITLGFREDKITTLKNKINYLNTIESQCESCQLCNGQPEYGVGGVYYEGKAYCIWVEGKSTEEIYILEVHEQCHDLVYRNYTHFCNLK